MSDPPAYLVMCGADREISAVIEGEDRAVLAALEHDRVHHCTPWVQYPLEHVHHDEPGMR